jgi:hypothetical protein
MQWNRILANRIGIGLLACALILWLWHDSSPDRAGAIKLGLSKGQIGRLSATDSQYLLSTIRWLANASISASISLNQPYSYRLRDKGVLQVYTTSPAAEHVTYCGKGNAVYDSVLDAVFIDDEIVNPTDWQQLLATPDHGWGLDIPLTLADAPWLHVYLRFVILHELGHRQLHRHSASSFDLTQRGASAVQRRRESEADDFAIGRMRSAYAIADRYGVRAVEEYTGDTINIKATDRMPIPDQVQASLVEMAQAITQGRLVLPSATSPLRDDIAHPSFLDRAEGLVRQSLENSDIHPDLKLFTEYVRGSLDRMQQARRSGIVEMTARQPVTGIQFDSRGLLVFTSGILQRIAFSDLEQLLLKDRPESVDRVAHTVAVGRQALGVSGEPNLAGLWSPNGIGTVFLWSDGQQTIIPEDLGHPRTRFLHHQIAGLHFDRVISGPQPSSDAVAVGHDASAVWLISFRNEGISALRQLTKLETQYRDFGAPSGTTADIEHAQVANGALLLTLLIPGKAPKIWGWARVDLASLDPRTVTMLSVPAEMQDYTSSTYNPLITPVSGDREVLYVPEAHGISPVLINIVRYPPDNKYLSGRGIMWQAWRLSAEHPPSLLCGNLFLADYFNRHLPPARVDQLAITPRLPGGGIALVPPGNILVNIENDSIYLINGRSSTLLFHPGSGQITARTSSTGLVALSVRGGYRVFLLRMRRNDKSGES